MAHLLSEWLLVDVINAVAATTPTFSAAGNGVRLYPVNGDLDQGYRITYDLTGNASGAIGRWELNGGVTNQSGYSAVCTNSGGGIGGSTVANLGVSCNSGTASSRHIGEFLMYRAQTGIRRVSIGQYGSFGAAQNARLSIGSYNDTATNITSIRMNITTGAVTGTLRLFVLNPQRGWL